MVRPFSAAAWLPFWVLSQALGVPLTRVEWPVVILDPGHTPKNGGATSVRGIKEVVYNDRLASILGDSLQAHQIQVVFTRKRGEEISLIDRVGVARNQKARCYISLHHDSVQPKYLQPIHAPNPSDSLGSLGSAGMDVTRQALAFETMQPIRGYSLFVSQKNIAFQKSYALAASIGQSIFRLGRKPTWHHAEAIPGENRPLLDSTLGIYRYDDLLVLAKNPLPSVLIEFGVLVDRVDEAYVSDSTHQARFAQAVVTAIKSFLTETPP